MSIWQIAVAALVGIVSVARLTRLLKQDTYPPVAAIRAFWIRFTAKHEWEGWGDLATCPFCAAPWIMLVIGGWGYLTNFQLAWWIVNVWLAASYLAAMVVVRDGE